MRFLFYTLGCRTNQFETAAMEAALRSRGHEIVTEGPAVVVVNGCAVTAESARKSRQAARRLQKRWPGAKLAVCGCWPQAEPEEAKAVDADLVGGSGERLPFVAALEALGAEASHIREVSLGGKSYNTMLEYFFACFAMLCFFGCFIGQKLGAENAANVTPLAARRSISPERKSLAVLQDLLVGISIQFINALAFLVFLRFVLGISLNGNFPGMALISLLGSMTGVSLGIVVGSSARLKEGMKTLILVARPLFLCFLAGMMIGNMKYVIEERIPVINRINPAALISDALYFLNVYNDPGALNLRLLLLLAFACVMTVWAFVSLRRTRYESI